MTRGLMAYVWWGSQAFSKYCRIINLDESEMIEKCARLLCASWCAGTTNNYKNNLSSSANDYAPSSSSCADDGIAPSCLDDRHAHSMLVYTTNQKRATTSSSLSVEKVEGKACVANQDGYQRARTRYLWLVSQGPRSLHCDCCVNGRCRTEV